MRSTAIKLGMAVNTQIGYTNVVAPQAALVTSAHSSSTIFVAWEHVNINQFASNILCTYKVNQTVPQWDGGDYDRIYVFTIKTSADRTSTLTFRQDQEGLNDKLAPSCATAPRRPNRDKDNRR